MVLIVIVAFIAVLLIFLNKKNQDNKKVVANNQNKVSSASEQNRVSKKLTTSQEVAEIIRSMKEDGIPQGAIGRKLNNKMIELLDVTDYDVDLVFAYDEAARKILDTLVDRNLKGMECEKSGKDDQAIQLYEANVTDGFDGSHPYERLRIIYTSKKKYKDAIRVCGAFIDNQSINNPEMKKKFIKAFNKLSELNAEK